MGILLVGTDGHIQHVNRRFREMLGYSENEIIALGLGGISHPDDWERDCPLFSRLWRGEMPYCHLEKRYLRKDGRAVSCQLTVSLMHDEAGRPINTIGMVEDITERKQAEEELAKSKAMLQAAIDCLPFNFFAIGLDGRYMLQNAVSKAQQRGDAIGKLPEEVCSNKHDLTIWLDNNRRAFAGEKVEGEVTLSLGGEERFYYNVVAPIRDGGTLHGILGVNIDITERKRAEEALQKAHDELERRVEERTAELAKANEELAIFRKFADASGQGFSMADPDGHFLYLNPALCRMLDVERPEDYIGQHLSICYSEESNRRGKQEIEPAMMREGYWEGELPVLSRQGKSIPTWHHGFVIRDENGSPVRLAVVITDITAHKQADEALERERQSLWHMLQASDHERQIISYEIHDGLAQYLAAAGMQFQAYDSLRENLPSEATKAYETALELVRQAHAESRRLINEVRPPVIDETGLETALSHLVHEQRKRGGPKIEFHSDVQFGKLLPILENALYRITQEALNNACKHSKSKKVSVTMTQEDQDVRLEVRDVGIGFNPDSVKEGHFGVEGIRQRVRLLGGQLTIESKPDSGTLIRVVVPILEKPSEE